MKNSIFKTAIAMAIVIVSASCSDSSDDDPIIIPTPTPTTENTWTLNNYSFSRNRSIQTNTTYASGEPFTQVNTDSNIHNNNGTFKACNVVFWFNTSTEGTYTVKSENTLVSFVGLKYMQITCLVTDGAGHGAMYKSIDSETAATVTKVDGNFLVTVPEGITMTKTLDDGLADAPATITFKSDKVR